MDRIRRKALSLTILLLLGALMVVGILARVAFLMINNVWGPLTWGLLGLTW